MRRSSCSKLSLSSSSKRSKRSQMPKYSSSLSSPSSSRRRQVSMNITLVLSSSLSSAMGHLHLSFSFFNKAGVFLYKSQLYHTGGPFTLLGKDYLRQTLGALFPGQLWVIVIVAVEEHDHVGEFFDVPRIPEVAHHGAFVLPAFHAPVQLGAEDQRYIQLPREIPQLPHHLAHDQGPAAVGVAGGLDQLQVVDDNQA